MIMASHCVIDFLEANRLNKMPKNCPAGEAIYIMDPSRRINSNRARRIFNI
jgi:hypothetical protein